jgi:hypothetical protein
LLVLVGESSDGKTREFLKAIAQQSMPNRLLLQLRPDDRLPAHHPAAGKLAAAQGTTLFYCQGNVCSAPITEPSALPALLADPV